MGLKTQKIDSQGRTVGILEGTALRDDQGIQVCKDYHHYDLEQGEMHIISSGLISTQGAIYAAVRVGTGQAIHAEIQIDGSADMEVFLLEAPTLATSGTENIPYNLNRSVTDGELGATFYVAATLTATGTTIFKQYVPSSAGFGAGGGVGGNNVGGEWILDDLAGQASTANNVYVLMVQPLAAGTFNIAMQYHVEG